MAAKGDHHGHRQRMRKRFLENGPDSFSDKELLEFLLFYARPVIDTAPIADKLMRRIGDIDEIFDASAETLTATDGVNESTAVLIKLLPALFKRYIKAQSTNIYLYDTDMICNFFKHQFIGEKNERVKAAFIDKNLKLRRCEFISEGEADTVSFDIKRIVDIARESDCRTVILAHNHPSGDLMPSDEDISSTRHIRRVMKDIGITLLDHVIVARSTAVSLKEMGVFTDFL